MMGNNILVIGDLMIDRYWYGQVKRISPEAPVPVFNFKSSEDRLGGAGNVALNLARLDSSVELVGILGEDEASEKFCDLCSLHNIKSNGILRKDDVVTIQKLRMLQGTYQMLRVDFEDSHDKYFQYVPDLIESLKGRTEVLEDNSIIIFSDYNKGVLIKCEELLNLPHFKKHRIIIDPKGVNFKKYSGAYLLTPNFNEFCSVVGNCRSEEEISENAISLMKQFDIKNLLVTRSENGMTLFTHDYTRYHFEAHAKEVFDVTGAGDTVIAVISHFLNNGYSLEESVRLSNVAAGIVVSKLGTSFVTLDEIDKASLI